MTQPIGGRTYGGWRRAADARSASIQGGNTPQRFGRSITPTGPGRPLRPGWKIGSRIGGAPQGAQPYLGGWGRQGWDKGQDESMWSVKGGCTLSRPKLGDRMSEQSAPKQRKWITSRNQINHCTNVDGIGGREFNHLDESFQRNVKSEEMGRQAQPYGWCPGSLLTNLSDLHPRARLDRPMSAHHLKIGSWLDHPRSYYNQSWKATTERTGPGSRRNLEAASEYAKIFEMYTSGSILAQALVVSDERAFLPENWWCPLGSGAEELGEEDLRASTIPFSLRGRSLRGGSPLLVDNGCICKPH